MVATITINLEVSDVIQFIREMFILRPLESPTTHETKQGVREYTRGQNDGLKGAVKRSMVVTRYADRIQELEDRGVPFKTADVLDGDKVAQSSMVKLAAHLKERFKVRKVGPAYVFYPQGKGDGVVRLPAAKAGKAGKYPVKGASKKRYYEERALMDEEKDLQASQ